MCGVDGALGRYPVGIETAHVRWHSQQSPDEITNALALCALHHTLFDLGVLANTEDRLAASRRAVMRLRAKRAALTSGRPMEIGVRASSNATTWTRCTKPANAPRPSAI